jgi:hypothetical protein
MQRAALQLRSGELSIVTLIAKPPQCAVSARVSELLRALPAYGPVKVERLLKRCQVSPRKTIADLSDRQRGELIEVLGD